MLSFLVHAENLFFVLENKLLVFGMMSLLLSNLKPFDFQIQG